MDFLILPDHPAAARIVATAFAGDEPPRVITHPSGRPWVVGRWSDAELVHAEHPGLRLVLLGTAAVPSDLAAHLSAVTSVAGANTLSRNTAGSYHLAISASGTVRCQGTLSGRHQVFHTRVGGLTVAASRPHLLGALTGAGVDDALVAAALLVTLPPSVIAERGVWRGVHAVPLGHYLRLDPDGSARELRYWEPPDPQATLREAAPTIRAALEEAVEARTQRARPLISADLSGGMDSSSLCFLAARGDPRQGSLLTTHWQTRDPANDDATFSRTSAARLPHAEHLVLRYDQAPPWHTPIPIPNPDLEGPLVTAREHARMDYQAHVVAARGSTVHMTGLGGDELFSPRASAPGLRGLLPTVRYLRNHREPFQQNRTGVLRDAFRSGSYGSWLNLCAERLTDESLWSANPADWEVTPRMPAWASGDAVAMVRSLLRETAAQHPSPFAASSAQHQLLRAARHSGYILRRINAFTAHSGVAWEAPFLDDAVIEAALSIRPSEQIQTGHYKPVLVEAMRGIVPDEILGRRTKGEHSAEVYAGLDRNHDQLMDLCDDLHLADAGLADAEALRAVINGFHPQSHALIPLDSTLAVEYWLRSLTLAPAVAV